MRKWKTDVVLKTNEKMELIYTDKYFMTRINYLNFLCEKKILIYSKRPNFFIFQQTYV